MRESDFPKSRWRWAIYRVPPKSASAALLGLGQARRQASEVAVDGDPGGAAFQAAPPVHGQSACRSPRSVVPWSPWPADPNARPSRPLQAPSGGEVSPKGLAGNLLRAPRPRLAAGRAFARYPGPGRSPSKDRAPAESGVETRLAGCGDRLTRPKAGELGEAHPNSPLASAAARPASIPRGATPSHAEKWRGVCRQMDR